MLNARSALVKPLIAALTASALWRNGEMRGVSPMHRGREIQFAGQDRCLLHRPKLAGCPKSQQCIEGGHRAWAGAHRRKTAMRMRPSKPGAMKPPGQMKS